MIRSLTIKLGMLAVTLAVIWWMAWQLPDDVEQESPSADKSHSVSIEALVNEPEDQTKPEMRAGTAEQHVKHEVHAETHHDNRLTSPIQSVSSAPIDLNRADAKTLESLPGIGVVLARRVIEYRQSVGRFQTVEDLRAVKGIGPKTLERLKPFLVISEQEQTAEGGKRPS
ncbi:MAG: helix-hairpin-helix domain-containing protein [Nitrospira sp.]|nr:helix-hairpin-helix domain-containing protein [Nitrospira sp.]